MAKKDEYILIHLRDLIYPNKDKSLYYRLKDGNESVECCIYSKHMSESLKKHGCGQAKTFSLKFPYDDMDVSLYNHFIRGFFDGDGSISLTELKSGNYKGDHKTVVQFTGQIDFLTELRKIFNKYCSLNKNIKIIKDGRGKKAFYLCYCGCRQCIKIREYLYDNATIYLQRKKDKFDMLGTDKWKTHENFKKIVICNGCNKELNKSKKYEYDGNTYCYQCYRDIINSHNIIEHNNPIILKKRKGNIINIIDDKTSSIIIKDKTVLFDTEDIELVKKYTWRIEQGRVLTKVNRNPGKILYLNRYLMNAQDGQSVKYIDNNTLNNKKENLLLRDHR